jgi:hypothetical protein
MPLGNWNLQWLNHNSQRSYPLTESATKTDVTGTVLLPDNFLLGLYFPIHAGTTFTPENFFIRSVLIAPTGFNIALAYSDGTTTVDVAAANIIRSNYRPNRAYALGGLDDFADSVGYVVLGTLADLDTLPIGLYTFNLAGTRIEPDAIRPMIRGVSQITVASGNETVGPIYGNVTLVAGTNVRIDVAQTGDTTEIIFNAINGENLNQDCLCNVPPPGECIRCINGVCSKDGTFTIAQDDCVEITPIANGLLLRDTCAVPCCGCAELEALTAQLVRLSSGVTTLQNFISRLGAEVTQMSLTVLTSKLGDNNSDCAPNCQ